METDVFENPYLAGNFRPVTEENQCALLDIEGEIPDDLNGTFYRIGPNPFYVYSKEHYHWFDGDGMIHAICFKKGKANYQNRFIETKGLLLEKEKGSAIWRGFHGLENINDIEIHHDMVTKNVANTNLVWHSDRLLALWEGGLAHEVSYSSLETKGLIGFSLDESEQLSAHSRVDPVTGHLISVNYNLVFPPYCSVTEIDKKGSLVSRTPVELDKGVMIHDTMFTENYVLILDLPFSFDMQRSMLSQKALCFEKDKKARIGLLKRHKKSDGIKWFEIDSCYILHGINAFEEGDEVIFHALRMQETDILSSKQSSPFEEKNRAVFYTYRLNLATGAYRKEKKDHTLVEFPSINDDYLGRKNNYAYCAGFTMETSLPKFNKLIKYQLSCGEKESYLLEESCYMGESAFAIKDGGRDEDDGYLVNFMHDEKKDKSYCLLFDAKKITKGPICRISMPYRVPYGFHAYFLPSAKIRR